MFQQLWHKQCSWWQLIIGNKGHKSYNYVHVCTIIQPHTHTHTHTHKCAIHTYIHTYMYTSSTYMQTYALNIVQLSIIQSLGMPQSLCLSHIADTLSDASNHHSNRKIKLTIKIAR